MKCNPNGIVLLILCYAVSSYAIEGCSVTVNGGIHFGNYNPLSKEDKNAHSIMTVICNEAVTHYKIQCIRNEGDPAEVRQLHQNDNLLQYNLYLDPQRLIKWGDGTAGTSVITGHGHCSVESPCVHLIYGSIFSKQSKVVSGNFQDNVKVILHWNTGPEASLGPN